VRARGGGVCVVCGMVQAGVLEEGRSSLQRGLERRAPSLMPPPHTLPVPLSLFGVACSKLKSKSLS
jgi:hypothetical protein